MSSEEGESERGWSDSGGEQRGGSSSRQPGDRRRAKSAQQEVLDAALAADTATLVDMGFSRSKAREALLSCGRDVQAACEWLFANCT